MAKVSLQNSTLLLGANNISCLQDVSWSSSIDKVLVSCAGTATKEAIFGSKEYTMTVTQALESDDTTQLGYTDLGDASTLTYNVTGTAADIVITSTNVTIESRNLSNAINGFFTNTFTVSMDDFTIAAHT